MANDNDWFNRTFERLPATTTGESPPPMNATTDIVIGVEIEPELIRAVAYDASLIPHGTARRSTKLARGTASVIERVARCVTDAADEGDLTPAGIRAVGVALPGHRDSAHGNTVSSATLNWTAVPLEQLLSAQLGMPVRVGNRIHLSARAVWLQDLRRRPGVVAMLFWDGALGGTIVRDGRLLDAAEAPAFHRLLEKTETAWAQRVPAAWRTRAARDWRKALKRGEPVVCDFVEESLIELGRITARLATESNPDVIVIGGSLMEDRRAALLEKILSHAGQQGGNRSHLDRCVVASQLGDNAVLIGAAALAQDGI